MKDVQETEKTNHHITLWIILTVLIIIIAGGGAYLYWNSNKTISEDDAEKAAWMRVQKFEGELMLDSLESAISDYQWYFPNGKHANAVRSIKEKVESEKRDWFAVRYTDLVDDMEDFIRNHPDSYFRNIANRKLDSLSFLAAEEVDTYESYKQYLDSFNEGMYAKEAQKRMDTIDSGDVSEGETEVSGEVITRHFKALAEEDADLLKTTIASELTSYIGKAYITPVDVEKYMHNIHATEGRKVDFVLKNLIVSKEVNDHIPTYSAHFFVEEIIKQDGKTSSMQFNGLATINNEGKITSLILSQR